MSSRTDDKPWTFVTNHTQVLVCLAQNPDARLRDVAQAIGITERAAQRILTDLVEAGYVERTRIGRRNHYTINRDRTMRHTAQLDHEIGGLLDFLELGTATHESHPNPAQGTPIAPPSRTAISSAAFDTCRRKGKKVSMITVTTTDPSATTTLSEGRAAHTITTVQAAAMASSFASSPPRARCAAAPPGSSPERTRRCHEATH